MERKRHNYRIPIPGGGGGCTPVVSMMGVPLSWPGWGVPFWGTPILTWNQSLVYPLERTWDQWKYYRVEMEMGFPPPRCGQIENITYRRPTYAVGNNSLLKQNQSLFLMLVGVGTYPTLAGRRGFLSISSFIGPSFLTSPWASWDRDHTHEQTFTCLNIYSTSLTTYGRYWRKCDSFFQL